MEECQHQGEMNVLLFFTAEISDPHRPENWGNAAQDSLKCFPLYFFILEIFILVWHYIKDHHVGGETFYGNMEDSVFLQQGSRVCQSQGFWTDLSHTHAPVNVSFGVETKFSQNLLNLFYLRSYFSSLNLIYCLVISNIDLWWCPSLVSLEREIPETDFNLNKIFAQ